MKNFSLRPLSWVTLTLITILVIAATLRILNLATLPPGLYHDEAVNGLDIWNILSGQRLPIFFEANGGREPLFIYLQAVSVWLFGPTAWALRIVSALIGVATIAVFFLVAREMAPSRPDAKMRPDSKSPPNTNFLSDAKSFALLACAGLATSYWHLQWSRVGLRAISLPLLLCAAVYFFLVARRTRQARYALLAGLLIGLTFYSYLAARLVPLLFLGFLALDWQQTKKSLFQNALLLVTALVISLPLVFYFIQTPDAFASRTTDIALTASTNTPLWQSLLTNIARVAGMFFVRGDVEWRHGLALRPVLDPISAVLFVLGILSSFFFRRDFSARLAWVWLVTMLLPTILSQQAPDTLRAIGAVPVVYWFVALGWTRLSEWALARFTSAPSGVPPPSRQNTLARLAATHGLWTLAGVALLLFGSGFFTIRDYFFNWANDPRAYRDFDGEFTEIAQWLNQQTQTVYVPLQIYTYPTVQFLTLARGGTLSSPSAPGVPLLAARDGLALVAESSDPKNQYILLANHQAILLNPTRLPQLPLSGVIQGRYRALTGIATVTGDPFSISTAPNITRLDAQFNGIKLVGYQLDTTKLSTGQSSGFTLYWQRVGAVPREPEVLVRLMDSAGQEIARADAFPTNQVSVARYPFGQIIPDRHLFTLDQQLDPGRYALRIGLFDPLTGERWDVTTNGVRDDHLDLQVQVPLPALPIPTTAQKLAARGDHADWANGITLVAYATDTQKFIAGDSSEWTLYWQTSQPIAQHDTVFVQLVNASGKIVAQADHDPMQGAYPTTLWDIGQNIPDAFTLTLPPDLPAGDYQLYIGWYNRAFNQRVALTPPPSSANNAFLLQIVTVR